jgi:hypothetical protein
MRYEIEEEYSDVSESKVVKFTLDYLKRKIYINQNLLSVLILKEIHKYDKDFKLLGKEGVIPRRLKMLCSSVLVRMKKAGILEKYNTKTYKRTENTQNISVTTIMATSLQEQNKKKKKSD